MVDQLADPAGLQDRDDAVDREATVPGRAPDVDPARGRDQELAVDPGERTSHSPNRQLVVGRDEDRRVPVRVADRDERGRVG